MVNSRSASDFFLFQPPAPARLQRKVRVQVAGIPRSRRQRSRSGSVPEQQKPRERNASRRHRQRGGPGDIWQPAPDDDDERGCRLGVPELLAHAFSPGNIARAERWVGCWTVAGRAALGGSSNLRRDVSLTYGTRRRELQEEWRQEVRTATAFRSPEHRLPTHVTHATRRRGKFIQAH